MIDTLFTAENCTRPTVTSMRKQLLEWRIMLSINANCIMFVAVFRGRLFKNNWNETKIWVKYFRTHIFISSRRPKSSMQARTWSFLVRISNFQNYKILVIFAIVMTGVGMFLFCFFRMLYNFHEDALFHTENIYLATIVFCESIIYVMELLGGVHNKASHLEQTILTKKRLNLYCIAQRCKFAP